MLGGITIEIKSQMRLLISYISAIFIVMYVLVICYKKEGIWGQPISKNCHVFYRRSFPKDIKTIWHWGKIAWMLCIVYRLLEDTLLYKYSHIFCHSGRYKAYMPKKVFYDFILEQQICYINWSISDRM